MSLTLPTGRIPNETLSYCVEIVGGSIASFIDNDVKLKSIVLGQYTFTSNTNRGLLENIFTFVHNLPGPINENTNC